MTRILAPAALVGLVVILLVLVVVGAMELQRIENEELRGSFIWHLWRGLWWLVLGGLVVISISRWRRRR